MTIPRDARGALRAEDLLEHAAWIQRLARRLVGDEAEDLVQDTWVAALRRPPEGVRPLRPLRPWLAAVTRNLALNRRRGRARRMARETARAGVEPTVPTPEELLERGEEQRAVVDAVLGLDEPFRGTLLLRYFEGLEPREIATRQGIPGATVRARLGRGLERVRERLDTQHEGDRARWMRALAPLAGLDRGEAQVALAFTTTAMTMTTILKLAASTALAAGILGWFLQTRPADVAPALELRSSSASSVSAGLESGPSAPTPRVSLPALSSGAEVPASSTPSQPEEGQLLVTDARTGEPLPDLLLAAKVAEGKPKAVTSSVLFDLNTGEFDLNTGALVKGTGARFTTDAAGRVTVLGHLDAVWQLDAWKAEPERAERLRVRNFSLGDPLSLAWEGTDATLEVAVGPTFPLLLDKPPGLRDEALFAVLTRSSGPALWRDVSTPVRTIAGRSAARFRRAPVEEGEQAQLFIVSDDGRWLGRGVVTGMVGVQPPVTVRLEECATLEVVVRGEGVDGGELQGDPQVYLFHGDVAWRSFDRPHRHAVQPVDGSIDQQVFRWLAPGPYTLVAQAPGHVTAERRLDIGVHGPGQIVLELPRAEDHDRVLEGTVTSLTGSYAEPLHVTATEVDPVGLSARVESEVVWEDVEGEQVGRFRIEGVSGGKHHLLLLTTDELGDRVRLVEPTTPDIPLAEPGLPVQIVVRDDAPGQAVLVRAVDAATGASIEAFTVVLYVRDGTLPPVRAQTFDGEVGFAKIPGVARRELMLTARGYRPLRLPVGVLDPNTEGSGENSKAEIEVSLRPGWGAFVVAQGPEGPLENARVIVDGVEAGATDAHGFVALDADVAPERLEVQYGDWVLTRGPETDEQGRLVARERRAGRSLSFVFEPRR